MGGPNFPRREKRDHSQKLRSPHTKKKNQKKQTTDKLSCGLVEKLDKL